MLHFYEQKVRPDGLLKLEEDRQLPSCRGAAESLHEVLLAGGIKLIARSAKAVIVRLGLTPRLAATTEPSQMYMFL
jgi:hypothetical protein